MASKTAPKVPITLDKKRHLLLDLNAMAAFEDATGKNIMRGFGSAEMTAKDLRALLWACLLHEDENLTIEGAGRLIHTGNLDAVTESLGEAWSAAMPEAEEEQESEGDPLAPIG